MIVLQNNPFFGRPNRFGFGNQNRNVQQVSAAAEGAQQVMEQQQAMAEQTMEQQAIAAQAMEQQQTAIGQATQEQLDGQCPPEPCSQPCLPGYGCPDPPGPMSPQGLQGCFGATDLQGISGPAGAAASICIGSVTTGEPGSQAAVINSGTQQDAILNFVIPRGDTGTGGAPEVLAAVDSIPQTSVAGGALAFHDTPLISGLAITRVAGSADVQIVQPGIYQVAFDGTVSVGAHMSIPAMVQIRMYLDGAPVTGAMTRHTFTSTSEAATVSFHVPFQVGNVPANVQVVVDGAGFVFENITMTVMRMGDATAVRTAT